MQKAFLFDTNKCTGCQACIIACSTENYDEQKINWRDVYNYNESHLPEIPFFNLSLACNHCSEPACLTACPANAYKIDMETGAVLVNQDHCIGCKYCTWACPYDAPKFNSFKGVIEKCTFCNDRLISGKDPACVVGCPTGALNLADRNKDETLKNIPGFTETNLQPAIKFVHLREDSILPEMNSFDESPDLFGINNLQSQRKLSLKSEWPLALFTFIITILFSWFTAGKIISIQIEPVFFITLGAVALILSSMHLGNKLRAYRAILNFKTSWLSREIVFISGFYLLSCISLLLIRFTEISGWLAIAFGLAGLISIEMLYKVANTKIPLYFHSASTLLTAALLLGIIISSPAVIISSGITKAILYVDRKVVFYKSGNKILPLISGIRLLLGVFFPIIFIIVSNYNFIDWFPFVPGSVLIGELLDRFEFYHELEIMTPKKQIILDIEKELKRRGS